MILKLSCLQVNILKEHLLKLSEKTSTKLIHLLLVGHEHNKEKHANE